MDKRKAMEVAEAMYKHLSAMIDECGVVDMKAEFKLLSGDVVEVVMNDRKHVGFGHNSISVLRAYNMGEYPETSLKFDVYI